MREPVGRRRVEELKFEGKVELVKSGRDTDQDREGDTDPPAHPLGATDADNTNGTLKPTLTAEGPLILTAGTSLAVRPTISQTGAEAILR